MDADSPTSTALPTPPAIWQVWRIDDNANTFLMREHLTQDEAERLVLEFTSRGHKQTYWTERGGLAEIDLIRPPIPHFRQTAMQPNQFYAVDTNQQPWEERFNERIGRALFRKSLYTDPATGGEIRLVCYPAGVINPAHTHPCGHGMYVLSGTLVTHKGRFGPGHFVWFPEGEVMEHGAAADADAIVLFVTNKTFRIDYIG